MYDPDLISVAAELLGLPEDIFSESPYDGHVTSSTSCVENAALALGDSFDLTRQYDERAAPSTKSRLAHTTYSTRNAPVWAQARRSRHLFLVGVVITGWHLNTCTTVSAELLNTAKPSHQSTSATATPASLPTPSCGTSTRPRQGDERNCPSRRTSCSTAPAGRSAGIGVGPAAPNLELFLRHYRDTASEQWVRDQHLPAEIEKDLVEPVRFLHEEEDLIRNLVDPTTPRGIRYRRRVTQIEQHYGGVVPKRGDLPILWFDDDPNVMPRKLLILARGAIVCALFSCDLENIVVAGGMEIQTDLPLLVPIDVWCVHYIKRKLLDEMCDLRSTGPVISPR